MDARRTTVYNLPPELAEHPQYEVLRELGHGGMGVVYLAKNKLMDRLEVLKVVNKALLDRPGSMERFLRDPPAAKLNHPNVVAAYSALQIGELLVFAMEYVEGDDLDALVKSRGPLPVTHACHYVEQAAIGLQHAFEKGMVHRDIKPQNLILAREGKRHIVKVLDFGLAKATREKADDTALTGEGQMLGTPDFIAPEQTVDAAGADIRADIYSLGCTLYFLLTGAPPFRGKSLGAVILAHQSTEARPVNLVRLEVPEELAAVVRKMMAKEPAQRYQTPAEVVQALASAGKPAAKGTPPKSSPAVQVPAARERTDEEKRLLRAETILLSPEAAQATMLGPNATPGGAGDILSAKTILPDQARQTRDGRKPPPVAAENKKGLDWIIGAAAAGIVLVLGGVLIWGMYSKSRSKKTPNTPQEQQLRAEAKEPVVSSDEKKSPPLPEKGKPDDPPTPPAIPPKSDDVPPPVKPKPDDVPLPTTPKPEDPATPPPTKPKPAAVGAGDYDLTGGRRFVHFGRDRIQVVLLFNDGGQKQYFERVYDLTTGQALTPPLKHEDSVIHASFSPDGQRVVTASKDNTARLWDAATGKEVTPPLKHEGRAFHASFSPDGKRVVTASWDTTARVWDAATGKEVMPPLKHKSEVWYASFSPDGQRVVTAGLDKTARLWDAATGKEVAPPLKHEFYVYHASFSPDGKRVVTASGDNTARLWDVATGKPLTSPLKHEKEVVRASFSPDGQRVVTASFDNTARLWDVVAGKEITPPLKHERFVNYATFSPDGKHVVTVSDDNTARLWDAATGEELKRVTITPY